MMEVLSFGCRLNTLESEIMRARALEAGLEDGVLINSCAVTEEAVRQARQAIRRARRAHPAAPIIVSGCAAQTEGAGFAAMPEVDLVLGNEEKRHSGNYRDIGAAEGKLRVGDIFAVRNMTGAPIEAIEDHTRAFVEVQNGCDHRCTFCVIPFGRGNSRSRPEADILAQIRRLIENGYREIVLTGVDITSYGADLAEKRSLGRLVRSILAAMPDLPRLRLSSCDAIEMDADLLRAIAEEDRLMPHFHLSLQSGDDMILKRMKRRHSRAQAISLAQTIMRLRPGAILGADLIAGFPTESETMFENSLSLAEECGLTHLHVFPFSPRPGTPAARMGQLDSSLIKARAARLRALGEALLLRHLTAEIGAVRDILVERGGVGRTEHFTLAEIAGPAPGTILRAKVTGARNRRLLVAPLPMAA